MLMPLLVRPTDFEIKLVEVVISEFSDRLDQTRRIHEPMRAVSLAIDYEVPLPDLNVKPVHRNVQRTGEFLSAEEVGWVPPPGSLFSLLDAGAWADALLGDWEHLFRTVR
jgi:hypothetical protein